jgi:hypothetical protein
MWCCAGWLANAFITSAAKVDDSFEKRFDSWNQSFIKI